MTVYMDLENLLKEKNVSKNKGRCEKISVNGLSMIGFEG